MSIERYLAELSLHLRAWPLRRRRILAEVRAHLEEAGEGGVERFGDPAEVAARFNELGAPPQPRLGAFAALLGGVVVLGLVQGLEKHIPPAPWAEGEAPGGLETLIDLATVCYLLALVLAAAALVVRRPALSLAACSALGATVLLFAVQSFRRADFVAGSPPAWHLALVALAALTPPVVGAALATGARRRRS